LSGLSHLRAADGVRGGRRRGFGLAALALCAVSVSACATYTDRMANARLAAGAGNYAAAVDGLGSLLGVSSADELPSRLAGDKALLALDRAVLQQATERFDASQRDLSAAEQQLELLDLSTNAIRALGSYLYSDSARTYKIPPTERLAVNSVNLLNYVARGDLSGAAVEARRFQVMREYLQGVNVKTGAPDRLGSYLAGFVFEKGGEGDRALRYYDEALAAGPLASLALPASRLARSFPYRGSNLKSFLASADAKAAGAAATSELLVLVSVGRVPHRIPQRMPVGAAVGVAGAMLGDRDLDILKYSATKVLVYPELVATPSSAGTPKLFVGGKAVALEPLADLGGSIRKEYEESKPKILAAALTRMAARAAVSEGTRAAGKQENDALGDVLAILVEAALVALDRPDTRSWTMLPEVVMVARVPLPAGIHEVEVSFSGAGQGRRRSVTVPDKGWAALVVTEPR
jgi:hypothetical protein